MNMSIKATHSAHFIQFNLKPLRFIYKKWLFRVRKSTWIAKTISGRKRKEIPWATILLWRTMAALHRESSQSVGYSWRDTQPEWKTDNISKVFSTKCPKQVSYWVMERGCELCNPLTPESDQFQISPAHSPEILHHTVWRTWLFILLRWKIITVQILTTHLYIHL